MGLERLGKFAYSWRALLSIVAIVIAAVSAVAGSSVFDRVKPFGFQDPNSESARAYDELEAASGQKALPDVELLVQPDSGSTAAEAGAAARKLRSIPQITQVVTPAEDRSLISSDQRSALVLGYLNQNVDDPSDVGAKVRKLFDGDPAITVGGTAATVDELTKQTQDDLKRIELLALPLLLLISLIVFRGLVAAVLPVLVGGLSILTTLLLLDLLTNVIDIDSFAINIVTGLGLGLAIDYSLFLVTRFREELDRSGSTQAALGATMGAIGPMIVFSGLTVAVSLISLTVFPQRFLYSIGVGGALVALASAAVCLIFLPAFLALLGPGVNALAPRGLQRPPSDRRWRSLAGFVLRYPAGVAIVAVAVMVTAGVPFLRVELTRADADVLPAGASARQVEDVVHDRFASDPGDQILVAVLKTDQAGAEQVVRHLEHQSVVGPVSGPVAVGNRQVIHAQLKVDPFSDAAVGGVKLIRRTSPQGTLVAGPTAELIDQRNSLQDHIPLALALILSLTLVILLVMTGSLLLPVVALIMNALTVSVAFGVLVWIFQDGRLEGPLDYMGQGALDTSIPILLFAVAFGLSSDYGVFLIQRIAEARRTEPTESDAIAVGVARSGRPITSAAILFAVAMGAFAFSELIYVKEIAVGAAVAVLVDATIVRPFLFPAILKLLGGRAWWGPKWLRYASFRMS